MSDKSPTQMVYDGLLSRQDDIIESLRTEVLDLRAERDALREALRPFAEIHAESIWPDNWPVFFSAPKRDDSQRPPWEIKRLQPHLTVGDLRRAANALAPHTPSEGG